MLRRRTQAKTASGTKSIEDLRVGDLVLSKSDKTGEVGFKRVKRLFRNHTRRLTKVTYKLASSQIARAKGRTQRSRSGIKSKSSSNSEDSDSDGSQPSISSVIGTPGHDWFSLDRGWIDACELKVGERLVSGSGETLEVVSVETWAESAPVYNFEVEDWHTYFVAETICSEAVWVHNDGCKRLKDVYSITELDSIPMPEPGVDRVLIGTWRIPNNYTTPAGKTIAISASHPHIDGQRLLEQYAEKLGGRIVQASGRKHSQAFLDDTRRWLEEADEIILFEARNLSRRNPTQFFENAYDAMINDEPMLSVELQLILADRKLFDKTTVVTGGFEF